MNEGLIVAVLHNVINYKFIFSERVALKNIETNVSIKKNLLVKHTCKAVKSVTCIKIILWKINFNWIKINSKNLVCDFSQ